MTTPLLTVADLRARRTAAEDELRAIDAELPQAAAAALAGGSARHTELVQRQAELRMTLRQLTEAEPQVAADEAAAHAAEKARIVDELTALQARLDREFEDRMHVIGGARDPSREELTAAYFAWRRQLTLAHDIASITERSLQLSRSYSFRGRLADHHVKEISELFRTKPPIEREWAPLVERALGQRTT